VVVSADNVAATLSLVVPGFLALSIFYWFGLQQKRTDWRWVIWSLALTAPIAWMAAKLAERGGASSDDLAAAFAKCGVSSVRGLGTGRLIGDLTDDQLKTALAGCANTSISGHNPELQLVFAVLLALLVGGLAVAVWRSIVYVWPGAARRVAGTAWEDAFKDKAWIQVKTDDALFSGYWDFVSEPTQTDDLDIIIKEPAIVAADGSFEELTQVDAMLFRRADIRWIELMKPNPTASNG
jgi:hypothetical protein